ncbi:MAG TPA: VOC family protein [Pirellulaceae bacterium]
MPKVSPIPAGCNTVNAYLVVKDARKALDFYAKAFGGSAGICMTGPNGKVMHGEVMIGNSTIMITEENPQWGMKSAETMGGSPMSLHLYVDNVDQSFQKAIQSGCTLVNPVMDMFWGDRYGKVSDPFGFHWGIATHIEDVSEEEMKRRSEEWMKSMANAEPCSQPA